MLISATVMEQCDRLSLTGPVHRTATTLAILWAVGTYSTLLEFMDFALQWTSKGTGQIGEGQGKMDFTSKKVALNGSQALII